MIRQEATRANGRGPLYAAFSIYCLFVLFLFAKRVPNPDISHDTLNYQYFAGQLAWSSLIGETPNSTFLPLGMNSGNPTVSLVNYLLSLVLGYRIGTVLSLLSIMLAGLITLKIVSRLAEITWRRIIVVLPLLFVNEGLFQISTYFNDNFFAAVGLGACVVILKLFESGAKKERWIWVSLGVLLGLQLWKLTNAFLIIPEVVLVLILIAKRWSQGRRSTAWHFSFLTVPIASILGLSYPSWMWIQSGNPFFPFYNSIFNSQYWDASSWSFPFGPQDLVQTLFYPLVSSFQPTLLGEVKDVFPDIRLNILFFLALLLLVVFKRRKLPLSQGQIVLAAMAFSGYALWVVLFGYSRYAIGLEFIFGALIGTLLLNLSPTSTVGLSISKSLQHLSTGALSIIAVVIFTFNALADISFRPTLGTSPSPGFLLQDSPLSRGPGTLPVAIDSKLKSVDIVIQCTSSSSGLVATERILHGKPFVNIEAVQNFSMTTDLDYINEVDTRLINEFGPRRISFVAIYLGSSLYQGESDIFQTSCKDAFDLQLKLGRTLQPQEIFSQYGFLGDERIKVVYEFGIFDLTNPRSF